MKERLIQLADRAFPFLWFGLIALCGWHGWSVLAEGSPHLWGGSCP